MTIKIENEATNLCVSESKCVNADDTRQYNKALINKYDELGLCSTRAGAKLFVSSLLRDSDSSPCLSPYDLVEDILKGSDQESYSSEDDTFVDDESSISSCGTSQSMERDNDQRRVQFAPRLVSEVRERPRTPLEDISTLFYSHDDTQRFRQEYRMERSVKSHVYYEEEECIQPSKSNESSTQSFSFNIPKKRNRHKISRLVVEHQGTSRTFYNNDDPTSSEVFVQNMTSDNFFDNDSFWNGSITWYY